MPRWLRYLGPMLMPILLGAAIFYFLREPLNYWRQGEILYDEQTIKEWVREARVGSRSLPEILKEFLKFSAESSAELKTGAGNVASIRYYHQKKRDEIHELLKALCVPTSTIYTAQLPLFPAIHRLEIRFDDALIKQHDARLDFAPIAWDSDNPRHPNQYRELDGYQLFREEGVRISMEYQLHAYTQKPFKEREDDDKRRLANIWILFIAFGAVLWILVSQRREADREKHRLEAEQQIQDTRQKHLEEELRRQEAEHKQEEAERKHLEEELRRQAAEREKEQAERQALELKSQMFHNIGIMAKSYAHNIKNLLVRPNDLLRRCMEEPASADDRPRMLLEIKQTLGTVTERLQEILQTVQRDPNKFERVRIDLSALAEDLRQTWAEQAASKWKMVLEVEAHRAAGAAEPLFVSGDRSHLQQTLENFLFNARDAISEMRNHLRKQARPDGSGTAGPLDDAHRHALIAAAGWKGRVIVRTCVIGGQPVLEVEDNGIGMTRETREHCTEPQYSTKRNNALYAGLSAGMGLGLSFVQMILEHHGATLEIVSEPLKGSLFRVRFPAVADGG